MEEEFHMVKQVRSHSERGVAPVLVLTVADTLSSFRNGKLVIGDIPSPTPYPSLVLALDRN